jgi:hypothetical protein
LWSWLEFQLGGGSEDFRDVEIERYSVSEGVEEGKCGNVLGIAIAWLLRDRKIAL